MNSLCKVALRTVMLGSAACGDQPSIIAFIVFARPACPAAPHATSRTARSALTNRTSCGYANSLTVC